MTDRVMRSTTWRATAPGGRREVIVKRHCQTGFSILMLIALVCWLTACNSRSRAETQSQQDQETRQKVADATAKAKQESEKAAQQLQQVAEQAEHEAKVAGQGVHEGWNRDKAGRLDLNSASAAQLRALSMSDAEAERVIAGRPYKTKQELVTRGILSHARYDDIRNQVSVLPPDLASH